MDRRRFFIGGLAALSAGKLLAQAKVWRIAYLTGYSVEVDRPLQAAFRQGLKELGYVDGGNVAIEARHAGGHPDRMGALASELAARRPDIFVVGVASAAIAAKEVAGEIPIVMANVQDPVATGLVKSLARPGGNITGLSDFHAASVTKRLELMREAFPPLRLVGVLWNADSATSASQLKDLQRAAKQLGVRLVSLPVRKPAEIESAVRSLQAERSAALLLLGDFMLTTNMGRIARQALEYRLPAAYTLHGFAEEGGFMSYGTDFTDLYRRSAHFVDRILKGAKPGELPIELPTKFQLVINLRTAKSLGIALPPTFLVRADHIIQ
jgi:putative ABC transport system substrate-binding protein